MQPIKFETGRTRLPMQVKFFLPLPLWLLKSRCKRTQLCPMLLPVVPSCCAIKFESGQTFSYVQTDATTPNIVLETSPFDRCLQHLLIYILNLKSSPVIRSLSNFWTPSVFRHVEAITSLKRARGGTPIYYLYAYVPPKGVVILKLLI